MKSYKKNKSKVNKEIKRSERKKYLDTMMADMGISSLSELSSNEERKKWLKAVMPSKSLERKLKEMGYDLSGNKNKKSLGSRSLRLKSFVKLSSEYSSEVNLLKAELGPTYNDIVRFLFIPPFLFRISARKWASDDAVSKNKAEFDAVIKNKNISLTPEADNAAKKIIEGTHKKSRDYLKNTPLEYTLGKFDAVQASELLPSDRDRISRDLAKLQIQSGSDAGSIERAIIEFKKRLGEKSADGTITSSILYYISLGASKGSFDAVRQQILEDEDNALGVDPNVSRSNLSNLKNIVLSNNLDFSRVKPDLMSAIIRMDSIIEEIGAEKIYVNSLYRSDNHQAKVMLSNYKRMMIEAPSWEEMVAPATRYMINLYGQNRGGQVAEIYSNEQLTDQQKISGAESLISGWPKSGHGLGRAMDISSSRENSERVLKILGEEFHLRTLWEPEPGPHHHVVVSGTKQQS